MATILVGQCSFQFQRRSESTWDLGVSKDDDSLGPHIVFQHGTEVLFVELSDTEIAGLRDWCNSVLKVEG